MAAPVAVPAGFEPEPQQAGIAPPPGFEPEKQFGIDFAQPVPKVREAIGKLPEADRPEALRQWADSYVAAERASQSSQRLPELPGMGIVDPARAADALRQMGRGTIIGPWLDEIMAGASSAANRLTGGAVGSPYDEAVALERARDRAVDAELGGQVTALQVAGGLTGGGLTYAAARRLGLPSIVGSTLPRQIAGGAAVGGAAAANYAAGTSEGTPEERLAAAEGAALPGAVTGAIIPPAIRGGNALLRPVYDYVSPTIARAGAAMRDLPSRLGIHLSADGGGPVSPGAQAAAETVIANQAVRSGVNPEDLRNALLTPANRYWSNSFAQDARVLADLDPSLQRLASSAGRASPEAGNIAATVMRARQTGITPEAAAEQRIVETAGIPTREAMTAAGRNSKPAGQSERIRDAFRRSMLIEDADYHGHLGTGLRTEQSIVEQARKEADDLYGAAYKAGENVDLTPALAPVFQRWSDQLAQAPQGIAREIQRAMRQFFTKDGRMVGNLRQFEDAKQFLDDHIEKLLRNGDRRVAGIITQLKSDLLGAVDAVPNVGPAYQTARNTFAGRMEMRDALQAGRDAFKEQSEIGADAFRALQTEGERKLFRLGLLDSYTDAAARMRSGADRLSMFDNPRIRDILSAVIPVRGSFDNPRQFGRYLGGEQRMIATRNEVVGNSKTAQRLADDEAYRALNTISEVFQATGSPTAALLKLGEKALHSVFGMRQDTSSAIARQLFTAEPAQRRQNLEAIIARMGANRAQQLAMYLQRHQATLAAGAARGTEGIQ